MYILTTNSKIQCSHGGVLQFDEPTSDNLGVLTSSALLSAKIIGCSREFNPCSKVVKITDGTNTKLTLAGESVLNERFQAVTNSNPPGSITIVNPGHVKF